MIDEIISILASALTDKMKENKIRVDENADDTQKILNYLDNRERFIDIFPRNVVESEELKYKLEKKSIGVDEDTEYIFNGYNYIKSLFENGKNINYHLSRKIFDSRDSKKDMLLNAWKIKHVHLTDIETNSKTGMKRNGRASCDTGIWLYSPYRSCKSRQRRCSYGSRSVVCEISWDRI